MPFKDRTNIKYGKLTAIEYLGKSMWRCKCDCGNEKIISKEAVVEGKTKSCGCLKHNHPKNYKDLTGQRFGRLTVIKYHHSKSNAYWLCQCDCGNTTVVNGGSLCG